MIGAVSSFSSVSFSYPRKESVQFDHDHTPDICSFCQPKSEKSGVSTQKTPEGEEPGAVKRSASGRKPDGVNDKDAQESSSGRLTAEEKKQVEELKERDREVRAHEQAHLAAAGGHARGGPSFSYQRGPDGVMYAVGGEVPIDLSPVADNPQATLQKAAAIQRAALAPAEPSGPDRQVAAQAAALAAQARQEIAQQSQENTNGEKKVASHTPSFHREGTYFPSHQADGAVERSTSPFSPNSLDFQQKQQKNTPSPGALLNVFA